MFKEIKKLDELQQVRTYYFGKDGVITNKLKNLRNITDIDEKKASAKIINEEKNNIEKELAIRQNELEEAELENILVNEKIDISLPSTPFKYGSQHPLNKIIDELKEVFSDMSYEIVENVEVETIANNFDNLNISDDHPSRSESDTFYIDKKYLLRTQTSSVQIRYMKDMKEKQPFKMVCAGKVYRRDEDDATHSHQFYQMEALVVDEKVNLQNLKYVLEELVRKLLNKSLDVRFRPSYFPFTEPSYEVDIECFKCLGKGCPTCKQSGFIELLGAGMVHPQVLENCGFDSTKYQGFAFGIGIERLAMLKYEVNDIRDFYTNDLRFIRNFNRVKGD